METDRTVAAEGEGSAIHRIEFDVEWPPGHAAAYLLRDDDPMLVDAGMPGEANEAAFREGLAEVGLEPADIEHVVVTHPHVDHIGVVGLLRRSGDPTVYAPASYRERLASSLDEVRSRVATAVRRAGIPDDLQAVAVEGSVERTGEIRDLLPAAWVGRWMPGDETIHVGDRSVETVRTPGHQRDHLCLATDVGEERALFSGDMAIRPFRAAAVHANFDPAQREGVTAYYEALDRLSTLDVDRVYPGHGPAHDEFAAANAAARGSLDRLCDRTAEALRESGTHAVHVASERHETVLDGPWLPEAVAALAHLDRAGRSESYLEDGVRYYTPA